MCIYIYIYIEILSCIYIYIYIHVTNLNKLSLHILLMYKLSMIFRLVKYADEIKRMHSSKYEFLYYNDFPLKS